MQNQQQEAPRGTQYKEYIKQLLDQMDGEQMELCYNFLCHLLKYN